MSPLYRAAIREITSSSLTITNPRGPTTNIEGAGDEGSAFNLSLSFGHGITDNQQLPAGNEINSFWLSPTATADIATPSQVREWPTPTALSSLGMRVFVNASNIIADAPYRLIITVDGVATGAFVDIPTGVVSNLTLATTVDVLVAVGSNIGVLAEPGDGYVSGTLRTEVQLFSTGVSIPPAPDADLQFLFKSTDEVVRVGPVVSDWGDISGNDRDANGPGTFVEGVINGHPGIDGPTMSTSTSGITETSARTLAVVCKPKSGTGGPLVAVGDAIPFTTKNFTFDLLTLAGVQYVQTDQDFNDVNAVTPIDYTDVPLIAIMQWDGTDNPASLRLTINGVNIPLSTTTPATPTTSATVEIGFDNGGHTQDIIFCEIRGYSSASTELHDQLLAHLSAEYAINVS